MTRSSLRACVACAVAPCTGAPVRYDVSMTPPAHRRPHRDLARGSWAPLASALLLVLGGCAEDTPSQTSTSEVLSAPLAAGKNVLVVTLDTTRADALGCYGNDPRTTPHLDALAERSVRFETAYSATNTTSPSHLSLLSGQRSIEHRVFANGQPMDPATVTLPAAFASRGYRTAAFPATPFLGAPFGWQDFEHVSHPVARRRASEVRATFLRWLEDRDPTAPFFAWVHFYDPHTLYTPPPPIAEAFYAGDPRSGSDPLLAEQPFLQRWNYPKIHDWLDGLRDPRYPRAMYDGEVHFVDLQLGRIFEVLHEQGLADETVVVVTADHGEGFGENGVFYAHAGLFEHTLRVPLLVHVPGLGPGTVVQTPVTALDLAPTLTELCDIPWFERTAGASLVPLLRPATERSGTSPVERRDVWIHEAANNALVAVRRGRWKLIWPIAETFQRMEHSPQLFDLQADPGERNNLFDSEPQLVEELRDLVRPWARLGVVDGALAPKMDEGILRDLEALGYGG